MSFNKKNIKAWLFLSIVLVLFTVVTVILSHKGALIDNTYDNPLTTVDNFQLFKDLTKLNLFEPFSILLLQIISILIVSRIFSYLFTKIGQPTVIGEIIAGIVLGPTILGFFLPETYGFLFAPDSMNNLYIVSQIGLALYMFTIGMDLNISDLKEQFNNTFIISISSIAIPFMLGMTLAFFVYEGHISHDITFISFALFIGISMSITAFPVLARIVQEKGLNKTHLGTISIGSAAIDDVTAWILLVAVIAIAQTGSFASSAYTLFLTLIYIGGMIFIIRPFVKRIGSVYQQKELMNKSVFGFFILILIISAFTTQLLGIHALFGAFLAGVIMPPLPKFRKLMVDKIEDLSVSLLLPLFFVYTGLKTEIGLVNTPQLWLLCGLFIFIAITGKFGGGTLAAKMTGESWKDSLSLGVLMNTRGLMELIVLNIGLEMGILPPVIFAMLVLMALITTFMTTPLLTLIEKIFPNNTIKAELIRHQTEGVFRVLISLGNPENGNNLLHIAKKVLDGAKNSLYVNVLHITAGTDTHPIYTEQYAVDSFINIKATSKKLGVPITTEYKVADNVENEIVKIVNNENYDFLLVGGRVQPNKDTLPARKKWMDKILRLNNVIDKITKDKTILYPGKLLHDKTRYFIENSNCSVGVFINRDYKGINSTLIIIREQTDDFLLRYAHRILRFNSDVSVHIFDLNNLNGNSESITEGIRMIENEFNSRVKVSDIPQIENVSLAEFDFMMISYRTWEDHIETDLQILKSIPSALIINKKDSRFHKGKMKLKQEAAKNRIKVRV
jgi:Kef-type K+ transport system membrane component KefB